VSSGVSCFLLYTDDAYITATTAAEQQRRRQRQEPQQRRLANRSITRPRQRRPEVCGISACRSAIYDAMPQALYSVEEAAV